MSLNLSISTLGLGGGRGGGVPAVDRIADESAFGAMTVVGNWYMDGGISYATGSQIDTWTSTEGTILGPHTTLYNGTDMSPRPTLDASRGVLFEVQNGFNVADGLFSQTDNFAIIMAVDFDTASIVEYATKSALDTAVSGSTIARGAIARVTSDTNTTYTPDVERVLGIQGMADANLVNGLYVHSYNALNTPTVSELFAIQGPGGKYIKANLDRLGRLRVLVYNGSALLECVSFARPVGLTSGVHIVGILKDATSVRIIIDGVEAGAIHTSSFASMTDLDTFRFNSDSRGASTLVPINGYRYYCKNFAAVENWTWSDFATAYNTIAQYAGGTGISIPQVYGWLAAGQSWWQGAINITDTWTTTSGWDGAVDRSQGTNDQDQRLLTHEALDNVFIPQDQDNNSRIGPLSLNLTNLGALSAAGSYKLGTQGENHAWGAFKQLNSFGSAAWGIASAGGGGNTLALLSSRTDPAILLEDLDTKTSAEITLMEELLQAVLYQRDFWSARGKNYVAKVFFWQQGHSDLTNANYVSEFLAYYDELNADVKTLTGQTEDIICIIPQINYSVNGQTNRANILTSIDQKILDIVDNRGSRPIYCLGPMYQITNFIHSYPAGHRWIGELVGKVAGRIVFDNEAWAPLAPTGISYSGTNIDVTFNVPVGPLQFDTNDNNIDSTVAFDGVNTYGFSVHSGSAITVTVTVASPGVFSATAHGLQNGDKVVLATLGALPTGLSQRTPYFVVNRADNTFQLSETSGGAAINTSGSQSGTHYVYKVKDITSVTITDTGTDGVGTVRIALATDAAAGDVVSYTGWVSRFGNLVDSDNHTAFYRDQDWTEPFTSGSPKTKDGNLNDLRNWCCAFNKVLS